MSESKFNREMLALARDARELTQEELARSSGVSQSLISKAEHGLLEPSTDAVDKLANVLGFPTAFLFQPERRIGLPHFHVRQRARVPAKSLARIDAMINIRRQHVGKLLRSFELKAAKPIPQIDIDEKGLTPESVATRLREYWLIARGPVPSVTEIIEDAGGIVILSRFGTDLLDGLSIRSDGLPPLFFMNRDVPGDRFRMSLARELGHVVMHSIPDDDEKMEQEARRFATAFLMPAQDVRPYLADAKISNLSRVKSFWQVSIRDLIERAYELKLMTDYQYKTIAGQYKAFRDGEPVPIPMETPERLRDMVRYHMHDLKYSVAELAKLLCVREDYLQQAYLGRPHLRVVSSDNLDA